MSDTLSELRKLPALLALVNAWHVRKDESVELRDWYAPIGRFMILVDRYVGLELEAAESETYEAATWLVGYSRRRWDICAGHLTLDAFQAHPELMPLFIERLRASITAVLQGEPDPE